MKNVNRILFCVITALIVISCSKDSTPDYYNSNVLNQSETVAFEELLLLVSLKLSDNTYLVVKSIDSVNIFVNNSYWAKVCSDTIDTSNINTYQQGNMSLTTTKLNYLVVAGQDFAEPDFSTAGDYAEYLNSSYDLEPGEYACFIESFKVTFNDNSTKKYYPFLYSIFKIENNSRSAFAGEIEINID